MLVSANYLRECVSCVFAATDSFEITSISPEATTTLAPSFLTFATPCGQVLNPKTDNPGHKRKKRNLNPDPRKKF